jgi:hypothetical protein
VPAERDHRGGLTLRCRTTAGTAPKMPDMGQLVPRVRRRDQRERAKNAVVALALTLRGPGTGIGRGDLPGFYRADADDAETSETSRRQAVAGLSLLAGTLRNAIATVRRRDRNARTSLTSGASPKNGGSEDASPDGGRNR